MPQGEPLGLQRLFQRRPIDTRLDLRRHRNAIDIEHAIHKRKIKRHHRAELAVPRRHATNNARPAAKWHHGDAPFGGIT